MRLRESAARARVASRWDPAACVISQCLRAPEGRLLRSAIPCRKVPVLPANAYVIRHATVDDEDVLRRLAELDSRPPLAGPALIGEIDGTPAAAVSLTDGSIAADPFRPTATLRQVLAVRVRSLRAFEEQPSLSERMKAIMGGWEVRARSMTTA
jgi:hypothetical protein